MDVLSRIRSFLVIHCLDLRHFLKLFRNVFFKLFNLLRDRIGLANKMASPVDFKLGSPQERRMVHLKTKEECRLGNETIQVWTVELPRKHAEGILR